MKLRTAKAAEPAVAALIATHFELMRSSSPEESCHVMPADTLDKEGVHLLVIEEEAEVLAVGGIKEIEPGHGEIKSMHTSADARGRGLARQILLALIDAASSQGLTKLSLETGSAPLFAPARALYASEGFQDCAPFGDYVFDPHSVFMTRNI